MMINSRPGTSPVVGAPQQLTLFESEMTWRRGMTIKKLPLGR
jgi:hypothetical protein